MTPLQCADEVAAFLRRQITADEEDVRTLFNSANEISESETVHVITGFLPRVTTNEKKKELCPAIVVRPENVTDTDDGSQVKLLISVTTYDEDKEKGYISLYNLLEWVRFKLLANSPVVERWDLSGSLETVIPDEQPFPQWWGYLEGSFVLPQPHKIYWRNLGGR